MWCGGLTLKLRAQTRALSFLFFNFIEKVGEEVEKDDKYFKINMEKKMYNDWFSGLEQRDVVPITELKKQKKLMLLRIIQNELPEKQREYFLLYFYKNMQPIDIAKKYGVDNSTVSRQLSNAACTVRRFSKYLSPELYDIIENGAAQKITFHGNRGLQNRRGRLG